MGICFSATNWSWTTQVNSASERLVLLSLSKYAREYGVSVWYCFPNIRNLLNDTGLSKNTLYPVLKKLEELGMLVRRKKKASGWNNSNEYYFGEPSELGSLALDEHPKIGTIDDPKIGTKEHPKIGTFEYPKIGTLTYKEEHTREEHTNLTDKEKNIKKEKKTRESRIEWSRSDQLPKEWKEWINEERPELDEDRIYFQFKNYWTVGKGQGTKRTLTGWKRTWINWVGKIDPKQYGAPVKTVQPTGNSDYTSSVFVPKIGGW